MDAEKNQLVVLEAYTRDVGHGVARIGKDLMHDLGLSGGDIIEIKGKRRTVAKCIPSQLLEETEVARMQITQNCENAQTTNVTEKTSLETKFNWNDKNTPKQKLRKSTLANFIRVDGLIRNNAGIAIGDDVKVRKIDAVIAEKISVNPLEAIPPIDERYLSDALDSIPLVKGDNVMVPYFGGRLTFQVTDFTPNAQAVVVSQKTVFSITDHGPTLRAVDIFKYYSDGKNITFFLEYGVRKENHDDDYLVLEIHLHLGGFGTIVKFQRKLEKNTSMQQLLSSYKDMIQEMVSTANRKLEGIDSVNSADLIHDIEFEILEQLRALP